jgi:hypothetical protein
MAMSEPIKNEAAGAAMEGSKTPARMSQRRRRAQAIIEPESKVERPSTVAVFQASPTSIAGVLARHGAPLEATLAWGQGTGMSATASAGVPVFIVGSGREILGELLEGHDALHVGYHGAALARTTEAIRSNRSGLAREGFPEQYWYKKAGDEFSAERAAEAGGRRWVEVVDTGELPLETLDRVFPRCLVVNVVGGWLQGGLRPTRRPAGLPTHRYLEVRLADVKADPGLVERQLLAFLGEPPPAPGGEAA